MFSNEKENIFTDDVDYASTSDFSVWGTEDEATKNLLTEINISGKWLNLCAGDGRFNNILLEKASEVVALDVDESALKKLERITPKTLKNKLTTKVANIAERFPFADQTFDGIFCVGTLHLFPETVFGKIFIEMERVLKPNGKIIIDFATDIKRTYPDGTLWVLENEPNYTLDDALAFLREIFKNYTMNIKIDKVEPEKVMLGEKEYIFTSNFILIEATRN